MQIIQRPYQIVTKYLGDIVRYPLGTYSSPLYSKVLVQEKAFWSDNMITMQEARTKSAALNSLLNMKLPLSTEMAVAPKLSGLDTKK